MNTKNLTKANKKIATIIEKEDTETTTLYMGYFVNALFHVS